MSLIINAQKAELIVETGHNDWVHSVAFSPDGNLVVSGSEDRTIKLWDVKSGKELKSFSTGSIRIITVIFSRDGKKIAGAGEGREIRIWEVEQGKELFKMQAKPSVIYTLAFSGDGKLLATGGNSQEIQLWDAEKGSEIKSLISSRESVNSIKFSADSKRLVSGNSDFTVKLWDIESGKIIQTISSYPSQIKTICFSSDGKTLIGGNINGEVKLWDVADGRELKKFSTNGYSILLAELSFDQKKIIIGGKSGDVFIFDLQSGLRLKSYDVSVNSMALNPNGKSFVGGKYGEIKLWDLETGAELKNFSQRSSPINSLVFNESKKIIASGSEKGGIRIWSLEGAKTANNILARASTIFSRNFSPDPKRLAELTLAGLAISPDGTMIAGEGGGIKLWDSASGREINRIFPDSFVYSLRFSPNGKILAGNADKSIKLWDVASGKLLQTLQFDSEIHSIAFSPDGKILAGSDANLVKLWDVAAGTELKTFRVASNSLNTVIFSPDGKKLATADQNGEIIFWDVESGNQLKRFSGQDAVRTMSFSPDGKTLAVGNWLKTIKLIEIETGKELVSFNGHLSNITSVSFSSDGKKLISAGADGTIRFWDVATGKEICRAITIDEKDWVVTTPDGRFDTNKSLDRIEGLHWVVNDEILKPIPLDVLIRQYYEPGLLQRALSGEQFKPLPSIAEINRVQPKVVIKEIKPAANSADSVDLTVEVENVTADVTNKYQKKQLASGIFDLRLFRDGQLVGVSTPKDKLEKFIADAPRLVAETKASSKLIDTPEDRAWREANDIFKIKAENVKILSPNKASYTFRNIKLPNDGRKEIEFTAYLFNSDRVRSDNVSRVYPLPQSAVSKPVKKGRAFVVSIGVNASENPTYNLRYAVNDARKMQEIVGEKLKNNFDKYSEIVQIPLVSDYNKDGVITENTAQKAIIKGVFLLLAGNEKEVSTEILQQIPNREKIKPVEPEDTLIITFSGHGYADQAGIFYLLPFDIGKNTTKFTPQVLQKTISSDELSLWMQDITAAEMIMIIDACHSSAAVQGDGFKPGPMGSRGLGQLAYDKDMKILSATQADNVALEINSLQQGLLSYSLLHNGILNSLADADKNKQLLSTEWLEYAEKRVPELYSEVKQGKRSVIINGRNIKPDGSKGEVIYLDDNQKSNLNLQQPSLFDFKRRNKPNTLFMLP